MRAPTMARMARMARMATMASALAVSLAAFGGVAPAMAGTDDECFEACASRDWIMAEPGTGPEVGPLARLELGTAGLGFDDGRGGASATAAFARARFALRAGRGFGVRASATVQALTATEAHFPLVFGAEGGGALALGVSRRLTVGPRWLESALTLDGEVATGPAVRSGLGLRALGDDRRVIIAPGLAGAFDGYVASTRGHVRYLRALDGNGARGAVEAGVGASMRINWGGRFWGGTWPLEVWADARYRRGLGDSAARELEVRGGLDYTAGRWVDRVGVEVAATDDRTDGGPRVHGLAMMITLQRGAGR